MDTKVGKRALTELSKRMDSLNVEFCELGKDLAKLKASDWGSDRYYDILGAAQDNRDAWQNCQDEISRLIKLEKFAELFK